PTSGPVSASRRRPVFLVGKNPTAGLVTLGSLTGAMPACWRWATDPGWAVLLRRNLLGRRLARRAAHAAPVSTLCRWCRPNRFDCNLGRAVSGGRPWLLGNSFGICDR